MEIKSWTKFQLVTDTIYGCMTSLSASGGRGGVACGSLSPLESPSSPFVLCPDVDKSSQPSPITDIRETAAGRTRF